MIPGLNQLLIDRFQLRGVNINEALALLLDLAEILESTPEIDLATINSKLQRLG